MHDINFIRENPDLFNQGMKKRGLEITAEYILQLDEKNRNAITELQNMQQKRNILAKEIGNFKDKGSPEFKQMLAEASKLKEDIASFEAAQENNELTKILCEIPNLPDETVPVGKDENDHVSIKHYLEPNILPFEAKNHWELGENLKQMDFETAVKISGSRFVLLKKDLARMERALQNFMLDSHVNDWEYTEIVPPYLVKDQAMFGVGQLPKFAEESFQTTNGYRLIPTSEVSLTNIVADAILNEKELPLRFTAYSPCFRSEAGSAGKDTRGMIRQHQFTKVELVSITTPEHSNTEHERMLAAAESILQKLELPYRVMLLCSGDMGFSAQKTYDIEVWLPGQNTYREISSCSNCGDFQGRRMKARFKRDGENFPVHTLNGSGLAVGRTMVAILENYQQEDGSIIIPEKLVPYMGGVKKIEAL
ncbi:MAG: serine--tRNA ligase [Alphaproteobacteria bacterium]|nr:serine--tRNA ligase [Alphaproteobacteria bacterium]OJV15764.1 MAG: serine--tRNA ligase [Alphaproteobacteria bacterium 33-17]